MKLVLSFLLLFTLTANAQSFENDKAIGLRLGGGNGLGTEISFQLDHNENNRFEADLGWKSDNNFDGFKITAMYQWVWYIENNFSWYAGAGGGFGNYSFEVISNGSTIIEDDETFITIGGQVGIEYNFDDLPLRISIDTRPELGFGDFRDGLEFDFALGVRYRF